VNPAAEYKRIEAARRQEERLALKRQRALERALKELDKRSIQEQARLEVESFENAIDVLISIHKDVSAPFDWIDAVAALAFHAATVDEIQSREWLRSLAHRVLTGDPDAYETALLELSSFGELSALGSALEFGFPGPTLVEGTVVVNGVDVIPGESKSLTAAGKVSTKPMSKARFHEIYQDHVCSCVLRLAREVFALLPVAEVIVTARVRVVDSVTGQEVERPVLSVAIPRQGLDALDFARLDPSDAMANFRCRGDAMVSRKSGAFTTIEPLHAADLADAVPTAACSLAQLRARVHDMSLEIGKRRNAATSPRAPRIDDFAIP
jgi:hypothetical protein